MQSSLIELYAGTGLGEAVGSVATSLDVAVHGLNPSGSSTHAIDTWEDKNTRNLWLRDRIPEQQPNARVFLYTYNSSPVFGNLQGRFIDEANHFLECLRLKRRKDPKRPLILLGHSLGGILIKQALVNAFANPKYQDIQDATYGIVFFGTPHGGPGDDWRITFGKACVNIAQSFPGVQSNDIMEGLKKGSLFSDALQNQWRHRLSRYKIVTFYEGIGHIVPQSSAMIGLPGDHENQVKLHAKHSDMCRFNPASPIDNTNYDLVEGNILELCENASQIGIESYEWLLKRLENGTENPRRDEILKAHNESLEWIWDDCEPKWAENDQKFSPGFVKWTQSEDHIFWIHGKPGAGKSTLMKQLIDSKKMSEQIFARAKPVIAVSYFFYELGQPQEKRFSSLLQTVLYALLQRFQNTDRRALSSIIDILKPQVSLNPRDQSQPIWKDEKLKEALRQTLVTCQLPAQLWLFVDGMDECEGNGREQLDFLTTWIESSTKSKLSIKACVASRDETEIRLRLSKYPSLPIHEYTKANISTYVTRRLGAAWEMMSRQPGCTTAMFDQGLVDVLTEKAEGVFLWVDLVVTQLILSIEEDKTAQELRMQLNDLPDGLRDLYSRIVAKIPQKLLHDAANFLRLYDHSIDEGCCRDLKIKPHLLSLWEFCAAAEDPSIAISCKAHFENGFNEEHVRARQHLCTIMKRRIQRTCRGLIHVEDTSDMPEAGVTLLHRTVKEFLIRDDNFRLLLARADQRLIRDPEISLMAMSLRLLKIDLTYEPEWIHWASPENSESTSEREAMERRQICYDPTESDIVYFFLSAAAAAARKTGSSHKLYIDELDRVLSSRCSDDWAGLYYRSYEQETHKDWNTNLLCLAFAHEMDVYIEEAFKTNSGKILARKQRPLMCYFFDMEIKYDLPDYNSKILEILLSNGADPNEQFQKTTPWALAVRSKTYLTFLTGEPLHSWDCSLQRLLEHGANPSHRIYLDSGFEHCEFLQTLVYTTALHVLLCYLPVEEFTTSSCLFRDFPKDLEMIRSLLGRCEDFDAADSDGNTITAWAYKMNKRLGRFIGDEITAIRERQRVHSLWI